jgi:hypothetical protein
VTYVQTGPSVLSLIQFRNGKDVIGPYARTENINVLRASKPIEINICDMGWYSEEIVNLILKTK